MDKIQLLTAKDLQRIFHIGKNSAYALMRSNGFPTLRINDRMYVPTEALQKWINDNTGRQYLMS